MNTTSQLLLLGVGTAGCAMARGISRAFGDTLHMALVDTDATTALAEEPFILLGGDRLSGHGSGGDIVAARKAAEDSIETVDSFAEGVRLAVVVTALGGGTGGGATLEIIRRLSALGIPSIVFATTPFAFEGNDRQRAARGVMPMIEEKANASIFLPLDKLVGSEDNVETAFRRAIDTLSSGVTLFWRLIEKPGYLRLDVERLRHLLAGMGRGRFATVTVQGADRAAHAVDELVRSELLTAATAPVRAIVCGVLAGEDLRLSEIGTLANGITTAFGANAAFSLATVNDEKTFCGRLSVVLLLFETGTRDESDAPDANTPHENGKPRRARAARNPLGVGPTGRGRFNNAEPTIWHNQDLDIPTFIRENLSLDF